LKVSVVCDVRLVGSLPTAWAACVRALSRTGVCRIILAGVMPPPRTPPYRERPNLGPDPILEGDVVVELIRRATVLRRRLLLVALGGSFLAGLGGIALFTPDPLSTGAPVHLVLEHRLLRSGGVMFVTCAILAFTLLRRALELVARARESAWVAECARQHSLDPAPLTEALAIFHPVRMRDSSVRTGAR
jgi:hypothetical protein